MYTHDTIAAIATAPGRGGVGIIRISGSDALSIAKKTCLRIGKDNTSTTLSFSPRHAYFAQLVDDNNSILDEGIGIYFPKPHSFTGEDVFEFQGHGGPVILDIILQRFVSLGARIARPGEFSERAFLNDKMDLTQAEAIADLINANSKQAALQASHSLRGAFADEIHRLLDQLTRLRLYVESAIDFPEEEIDFLGDGVVDEKLSALINQVDVVTHKAQQGAVIRDGMNVVLAGRPNAGKSTLLNALAERDVAIVTDEEGTTRDTLTEHIHINGMPLHITDTAGLRDTKSKVEKIGIERAWQAFESADRVLLLIDATFFASRVADLESEWPELFTNEDLRRKLSIVVNKTDITNGTFNKNQDAKDDIPLLSISALTGRGIEQLKQHLLEVMGLSSTTEGGFSARRRHLEALTRCLSYLKNGQVQLQTHAAGELLAEDLRLAQNALGDITGKLSADELLGKIFSSFCIGK